MKKRICMVVPSFTAKGGIAAVVDGYRTSRLLTDYDVQFVETFCDGGKIIKVCKAIKSYFRFLGLLIFWHPHVIHIHSSFGASFYRKLPFIILASWAKKPVINHLHGADFDVFYRNAPQSQKAKIRKAYAKCSVLVALSDEWKQNIGEIVPSDKIVVIENYSTLHVNDVAERMQKPNAYQILFLGFIGQRKGCYDIPAVVEKVTTILPEAKFILAGSGEIEHVRGKILPRLQNCVKFPGWVRGKEKEELIHESDIFFLPSYNEGMPMSVLDAMGYGMPVVSTRVGGIPKIVREKQNGYLFEPGDTEGMAQAIIRILQEDELRRQLGAGSADIVRNEYSLERHIEKVEAMYQSIFLKNDGKAGEKYDAVDCCI